MGVVKTDTLNSLPDDVEALKRIIVNQLNLIAAKEQRIAVLEEFVRLQKRKQFGASTEKSADQQEMFSEAELSVVAEEVLAEQEAERATQSVDATKPKARAGRKPLPAAFTAKKE